jgi:long-chain fatty acid transport protein
MTVLGPSLTGRSSQADNAVVVNQNPAGLTRIPNLQVVVDTLTALSLSEFEVDKHKSHNTGGNPDNDPEFTVVSQLAISYAIGDFRLGFGLSVPQGFGTNNGNDWAGRDLADETSRVFISAQPALAYRVNNWLSVGGTASIMYVASDVRQNVRNLTPGQPDGRVELEVDGFTSEPILSVLLEPKTPTRMGFTWRGEMQPKLKVEPNFKNLGPVLEAALETAGLLGKNIDMWVPQRSKGASTTRSTTA